MKNIIQNVFVSGNRLAHFEQEYQQALINLGETSTFVKKNELFMSHNTEIPDAMGEMNPAFHEKANQLKALVAEIFSMAPKAVNEKICEMGHDGKQLFMDGKDKAGQVGKQAIEVVRKRPVETALIAVAAGVATWWLITRK